MKKVMRRVVGTGVNVKLKDHDMKYCRLFASQPRHQASRDKV